QAAERSRPPRHHPRGRLPGPRRRPRGRPGHRPPARAARVRRRGSVKSGHPPTRVSVMLPRTKEEAPMPATKAPPASEAASGPSRPAAEPDLFSAALHRLDLAAEHITVHRETLDRLRRPEAFFEV